VTVEELAAEVADVRNRLNLLLGSFERAGQVLDVFTDRVIALGTRVAQHDLRSDAGSGNDEPDEGSPLTRRQRQVLHWRCAEGLTNDETAARMGISPQTVKNHVTAILERSDARSMNQACFAFERNEGTG
jgi:DNA-binding NarL/FixJ family response regulator